MRTPSYEELLEHPELHDELEKAARRERAKAVHELIIAPLVRLVAKLEAKPKRRASRWIAVHHGS